MENDLASRIATRLQSGRLGRSTASARDRLKLWVGGKTLCDPETGAVLATIEELKRWHAHEGLGWLSGADAADLWADIIQMGDGVDLGLWQIGKGWYYDAKTGSMHYEDC